MSASLRASTLQRAVRVSSRNARPVPRLTARRSYTPPTTHRTSSSPLPSPVCHLLVPRLDRRFISYKDLQSEESADQEAKAQTRPKPRSTPKKSAPEQASTAEDDTSSSSPELDEIERIYQAAQAQSARERPREQHKPKDQQRDSEAESKDKEAESNNDQPDAPRHGNKSPWQVFTETLSTEFKASKDWNEGTQQLSGSIQDFTQNPNVQKARSAYTKATDTAATASTAALKSTAGAIGSGAAWAWDSPVVKGLRVGTTAVGSGIERATRPLRETEAYKNVQDTIDDGSSSKYGGWIEKEERRRRREARELKQGRRQPVQPTEADPNAGTNVTLHKDAKWKESWREFRDSSKLMKSLFSLKSTYGESENPLISTARSVSDRVAGFFAENENARVIKKFRELDPSFQLEPFLQELREYILPEVLDAYVKGDVETLRLWLSAAQYQVYSALMHQYTQHGLKSDGKILDIRNVEVLNARLLEPGEIPVFVITCRTQEIHVYRKKKTGELASGMEDRVQQVTYAIGITRLPEDVNNPETRGWRLIELQKSGRDYL